MPPSTNPERGGEHVIDEAFVRGFASELVADFPGYETDVEQLLATNLTHEVKAGALHSIRDVALDRRLRAFATVEPESMSEWPTHATTTDTTEPRGGRMLRAWIYFTNYLDDYNRQSFRYRAGVLGGTAIAGMGFVDAVNTGMQGVDPVANRPVPIIALMLGLGIASFSHQKLHQN